MNIRRRMNKAISYILLGKLASTILTSLFIALTISFLTFNSNAAVAIDSSSSGGAFNSSGITSFTWAHIVTTSGNNRVLYVGVSTTGNTGSLSAICTIAPALCTAPITTPGGTGDRVISVTYNSIAMERVGTQISPTPDIAHSVEIFRLVNPPSGTSYPVVVNLVPAISTNAYGGSISFTGADEPTTQTFYSNSGSNSNPSLTVAGGTGRNGIALGVVAASPNAGFIGDSAGQTDQWNGFVFFSNAYSVGKGSTKPANPSAVFSWTLINTTSISWATGGVFVRSFTSTASPSSIGGQVKTKDGEPLKNVLIRIENLQTGEVFHTNTNEKGFYQLEGLTVTNLYQIRAYSNFYTFSPNNRVLDLTESADAVDFQATKRNRKNWFIRNQ